jgi:two-component system, sensor histidine kinase and response regulator
MRFSVQDTGIGIPDEKKEELFEAFTQLDASVSRACGGTGLGLTITKRSLDQMDGEVRLESKEGEGSTFSFEIESVSLSGDAQCRVCPPWNLEGLRAHIVDDSAASREVLREALVTRGVATVTAANGRGAVERLMEAALLGAPFDLILLDQHLPDRDGFSLREEVRHELPVAENSIVMLTSDDVPGGARRARELGVDAYLVKPVRLVALLEAIERVHGVQLEKKRWAAAKVRNGAQECEPAEASLREGLRVLLVEDNPVNRTVVEALLAKKRVAVTSVGDGAEAVAAFEESSYDLVLMDVQMPGMDGYEATRLLRARGCRAPILGLTAHAMRGDRERCLEAGMDDHLTKPVAPEGILRGARASGYLPRTLRNAAQ